MNHDTTICVNYGFSMPARPFRVLHAFDPRRCAILLIGGDKTGNDRWYDEYVPIADRLYDEHLEILKKEESEHGS